jgi:7-cyano-7-deazaguanine synthase
MTSACGDSTIGVLASGGLDSCILLGHLLASGRRVQPFYVQSGLHWERDELWTLRAFLIAMDCDRLEPLVVFEMPLADLYGYHWSVTGKGVPDAESADDAVYLPGRNALLAIKPAIWCRLHGIGELALAVLGGNPFGDATDEFFRDYESAVERAVGGRVQIARPFGRMTKQQVMELAGDLPLELTFSCIAPQGGLHCGRCNKCAERQRAFRSIGLNDPTRYVTQDTELIGGKG